MYLRVDPNDRFDNSTRYCCSFTINNWEGTSAWTMVDVYDSLPVMDRSRIEHIEMLDERELLTQLLQHYCIAVASNGQTFKNLSIAQG